MMLLNRLLMLMICIIPLTSAAVNEGPLLWGSVASRDHCPDSDSFLWIEHAQGFDCVRYFAGRDLMQAPVVIAVFSGDRDRLLKLAPADIFNNTRQAQQARAAKLSSLVNIPVVIVARPGTYGSSGDHRNRRQPREFLALDGALSVLKQRFLIDQFVLLGHSGGATAAAALLTMGRTDVRCAVLSSGAFDLLERSKRRAEAAGRLFPAEIDSTGLPAPYDPLYKIDQIVVDLRRRIYVLGNPQDSVTPFDLQRKFADAVVRAGHHVELREVPAKAPQFHDLVDGTGIQTAANCAIESR